MSLEEKILSNLSEDLRSGKHSTGGGLNGFCYVISESIYHITGGSAGPYTPYHVLYSFGSSEEDIHVVSHWYLVNKDTDEILDLVGCPKEAYNFGRRRAFLTKEPSNRAKILISRVNKET